MDNLLTTVANLLEPSTDPCGLFARRSRRQSNTGYGGAQRQNIFGSPSPPLKVLTTDPERVLALARVTLG